MGLVTVISDEGTIIDLTGKKMGGEETGKKHFKIALALWRGTIVAIILVNFETLKITQLFEQLIIYYVNKLLHAVKPSLVLIACSRLPFMLCTNFSLIVSVCFQ